MALMDAKEYDPRPARRMWRLIGVAVLIVVLGFIAWRIFRYTPYTSVINKFFEAVERKDFDTAYAIYNGDPNWQQHPDKYDKYSLSQFKLDWGPSGEYGIIKSHEVDCVTEPEAKDFHSPSGVIVVVRVNNRVDGETSLWVEKKTKTITTSPFNVECHPPR
jgi:hypothetical protein